MTTLSEFKKHCPYASRMLKSAASTGARQGILDWWKSHQAPPLVPGPEAMPQPPEQPVQPAQPQQPPPVPSPLGAPAVGGAMPQTPVTPGGQGEQGAGGPGQLAPVPPVGPLAKTAAEPKLVGESALARIGKTPKKEVAVPARGFPWRIGKKKMTSSLLA